MAAQMNRQLPSTSSPSPSPSPSRPRGNVCRTCRQTLTLPPPVAAVLASGPFVVAHPSISRTTRRCQNCDADRARSMAGPILAQLHNADNKIVRLKREHHHLDVTVKLLVRFLPRHPRDDLDGHSLLIRKQTTRDCKHTELVLSVACAKVLLSDAWADYWAIWGCAGTSHDTAVRACD